jgi:hypothetical protein
VNVADVATPLALVVAVFTPPANVPLAPLAGGVNVTMTPLTGLLPASVTVATRGAAKAVLIVVLCGVPLVAATFAAVPVLFVSEKLTVVKPVAAAVTVYGPPAVALAVNAADATPDAFVATVIVAVLLLKMPEAPDPGAVNVTFTPLTGLLPASLTVTARAFAKAVLIVADCGVVPAFAVMLAGGPGLTTKFTKLDTPPPGPGFVTVTGNEPTVAIRAAGIAAISWVEELNVVVTEVPLNLTADPEI